MEQVTAYRCQHCGKVYLRDFACKRHEETRCPQNPEIRPLCYSCRHYAASYDEEERVMYVDGVDLWNGEEHFASKLFAPNKCTCSGNERKLYNNLKLSDEMRAGLAEADYEPMPNFRNGGCNFYQAIPEHPYAIK